MCKCKFYAIVVGYVREGGQVGEGDNEGKEEFQHGKEVCL